VVNDTLDFGLYSGHRWRLQSAYVVRRSPPLRVTLADLESSHAQNFGWALACCAWQRELAEDVLQEAYLRVLDGRARFKGLSTQKTWFFAVIKRVASEMQRAHNRRSLLNLRVISGWGLSEVDAESEDADLIEEQALETESSNALKACLMQLPTRQREVLHLVFYGDLTLEESAQTLGVSLGSVRTHYHRGKARMAEILEFGKAGEQDAG